MKTTLIILTLLTAGGLGVYYSTPKQSTTEVSVMRDITSQQLAEPQVQTIMPFFNLDSNKWGGGIFRFSNITNLSMNQTVEATLPSQNEWLSSIFTRTKAINAFNTQVTQIISTAESDTVGKQNSSIYVPLANELNLLSQSSEKRRILFVYSDLMENDPNFSFYGKKVFAMLLHNPEKAQQYFEKEQPLNNLKGIEVYLIFQPSNTVEDYQFQTVSAFYKQLLEAAGAKVTITANLTQ